MKALITGASSGIGRSMAVYLAELGWDLILVGRSKEGLRKTEKLLKKGTRAESIQVNLARRKECLDLYEKTRSKDVDFLICNAGFGLYGNFSETDLQSELDMIATNVTAVHILTKLFLRDFLRKDKGHILLTASAAAFFPGPGMATYYATKHYVRTLGESLYEELRRRDSGVKISVLCPGPVQTQFSKVANVHFLTKGKSSDAVARAAIDGALRGKLMILPDMLLRAAVTAGRLVPTKLLARGVWHAQARDEE